MLVIPAAADPNQHRDEYCEHTVAERIQSLRSRSSLGQGLLLLLSISAESDAPFDLRANGARPLLAL